MFTKSGINDAFRYFILLLARSVPNVAKRSRLPTTDRPRCYCGKFQMDIFPQGIIRSTSSLVPGLDFPGRRIECRYFPFDQI